ncbi:hypothetical protein [Bradyrhizobium zhanjiangense]|uniref:hypothetical protein n=1 Tax=Bradyrhizobium zhanjiangense TaxID=1325107 RepID=UPI001008C3B0|nr:hypothetical protein [Bradyrhizobium zhanjiangense]
MTASLPHDFWSFQIKDLVTGAIALVGLIIASTNLYNAYLRRPKIVATPGGWIFLASHRGEKALVRIFMPSLFFNRGSEPALIVALTLKLTPEAPSRPASVFSWDEFVSRKEVRESGAKHHSGIRAEFQGKASALIVPKSDAVEKEIVFAPVPGSPPLVPGTYGLRLEGRFLGSGKRARRFNSPSTRLTIEEKHLSLVEERIVRDEHGQYLYSNHVQVKTEGHDEPS